MTEEQVLNGDTALSLLCQPVNPFTEDLQHSWSVDGLPPFDAPFLRIWDNNSGSQPDNEGRMRSRAPRQRLDTRESRKNSLAIHINHKIWEPTPYISFTTSPAAIQEMAPGRAIRRGPQTLTVVNPNTRIANRLPILNVLAEMNHYGVKDPYRNSNRYYIDHYVCLWEVSSQEIIGHWKWNDLAQNEDWYNDIILPAFRENATSRPLEEETSGLLAAMDQLSCAFLLRILHRTQLIETVYDYSDPSDPTHFFYGDSDSSSEGITCYFDEELENDTDHEVEEANAADDMLKIIESDW
jgi:hypothetical protein